MSPPASPTELFHLPQAPPQPNDSGKYGTKPGVTEIKGADLSLHPNTDPSAQGTNESKFSPNDGPTEFFHFPQAPQPNDSGKHGTKPGANKVKGADLTLLPNTDPSAQGPNQSKFSPYGGPTEFFPSPQAPMTNNSCSGSDQYQTETGVTGLEGIDLTLHPNTPICSMTQ